MVKPTNVNKNGSEQGLRKTNYISGPGRQTFESTAPSNGMIQKQASDSDDTPVNMGFASGPTKRESRTDQLLDYSAIDTPDMDVQVRMTKMKG